MSDVDEFAGQRLPDLPNAGYVTKREKELTDEIMHFLRAAERDRLWMVSMVCEGRLKFRSVVTKAMRHLKVSSELVDAMWGYLCLMVGDKPEEQRTALLKLSQQTPAEKAGLWVPSGRLY